MGVGKALYPWVRLWVEFCKGMGMVLVYPAHTLPIAILTLNGFSILVKDEGGKRSELHRSSGLGKEHIE